MIKTLKRILSIIVVLLVFTNCVFSVNCLAEKEIGDSTNMIDLDPLDIHYWDLLDEYAKYGYKNYDGADIELPIEHAKIINGTLKYDTFDGTKAIVWDESGSSLEWQINVPEDALYNIQVNYYAYNDKSTDIQRELNIDGKLPCVEWSNIRFTRLFCNDGLKTVSANGDETAAKLKQVFDWQENKLSDYNGYFSEPMKIYLAAGEHTLSLNFKGRQPMAIGKISLVAPEKIPSYSEVKKEYTEKNYKSAETEPIITEGENTFLSSSSSLRNENSKDLSCTPLDYVNKKINIAGGDIWKNSLQTISWEIKVPEDGLYKIGYNLYSYYNYGMSVYRRIEIDGKVPFSEMSSYCFLPSNKWRTEFLSNTDNEPYWFYLEKGTHVFSMSIVAGELTSIIQQLDNDLDVLSELHLDITLITTSDPDPNYDYKLEERIPGLIEKIENLYKNLKVSADQIKKICGNDKALTYAEMNNTLEDLKIFINNPFEIPSNISQFTNIMSQYGSWIEQLKAGTLSIDKILVIPSDEEYKIEKVSLIKRLYSSVATFISTFSKDYNSVIGSEIFDNNKEIIDVWYGGAQIYATELKDIIGKDFSNKSDIQVRFKLTPASQMSTGINAMLLAILSGEAPDVVLGAPSVEDYMMRNQCYDLKKFKDFNDVSKRFLDVCIEQLTYRGGVYAIPETMNVNFMFYRSDIFKKLGLTVPKTWDEMLKNVVPKLAENNMSVAGSPGFDILLYQHGGELYNEDMTESLVASQTAWKAFKMHCDFYTMYGAPKAADFYNRFRSGEIPVGFGNIGTYIQFIYMAPELSNRWNIAVMPGVLEEDGSINNTVTSLVASSSIIMAGAKHPNEAWEFLKWYTSTDVQLELSDRFEAKLDMSARLLSANVEAFSELDWDTEHLNVFLEAMQEVKVYNPVLGGYATSRYMGHASNYVIFSKTMTEREALEYAQEKINMELERRRNNIS